MCQSQLSTKPCTPPPPYGRQEDGDLDEGPPHPALDGDEDVRVALAHVSRCNAQLGEEEVVRFASLRDVVVKQRANNSRVPF